jgi:hypothetical protein
MAANGYAQVAGTRFFYNTSMGATSIVACHREIQEFLAKKIADTWGFPPHTIRHASEQQILGTDWRMVKCA